VKEDFNIDDLKAIPLFSDLTDEDFSKLRDRLQIKQFKKNASILHEEDTNDYMYVVLTGKVKAIRTTEDGKEIILAMHPAGDFFGEVTLIDGQTSPASVIATEGSTIAIIAKKDFEAILLSQGKVLMNLLNIFCARLRKSWETIEILNFNNASQRVKMFFLTLIDEYGEKTDKEIVLNIRLTHQDISEMTGLTRETVTRVIDRLQKNREIVMLKNNRIQLNPSLIRQQEKFIP
jgi:CRP/FNR family transcriptional regulator